MFVVCCEAVLLFIRSDHKYLCKLANNIIPDFPDCRPPQFPDWSHCPGAEDCYRPQPSVLTVTPGEKRQVETACTHWVLARLSSPLVTLTLSLSTLHVSLCHYTVLHYNLTTGFRVIQ